MRENGATSASTAPPHGRFVAVHALAWFLFAPLLGIAAARAAVWAEHLRAPLLVFPLLVGCGVGLALAALMRLANVGHRPTIMAGAFIAVIPTIVGQHYFGYRDYLHERAAFLAQKNESKMLEAFQDELPAAIAPSFAEYMRGQARIGRTLPGINGTATSLHGVAAWISWAIDGLITLASAMAIVYLFAQSPYCNLCGSWYHTVRTGRLSGETAGRVADAAEITLDQPAATARYRLSHCASGCGPARLELACEACQGRRRHGEAWLDASRRERVMKVLDGVIM
jgi:hypothetical protein